MDNKMNYQKALKKSTNKKIVKIGKKNYVLDVKRFKQFQLKMLAITAAVAITLASFNIVKDEVKFHFKKGDISLGVAYEMSDNNYLSFPNIETGQWDYRYDLIDDIDPFRLLIYMGAQASEAVLQYRGYENWEEYAKSEGYESKEQWYLDQRDSYITKQKKTRSK